MAKKVKYKEKFNPIKNIYDTYDALNYDGYYDDDFNCDDDYDNYDWYCWDEYLYDTNRLRDEKIDIILGTFVEDLFEDIMPDELKRQK